eukprot:TRINITY_DN11921_c0_g1_i1.p1 TRINITY_DN11921_c0_g1~~TRINITY_DN11921_c0_g1_i1.p1  ORF type:complete len:216 (+),score=32.08 TRINITY_DN11921_c0_g1_i1:34-681(+)
MASSWLAVVVWVLAFVSLLSFLWLRFTEWKGLAKHQKKVLILDLDETLIRATQETPTYRYHFFLENMCLEGTYCSFYVTKRPHLDYFLEEAHKYFELVIFTAGVQDYADPLIDLIDPKGYITRRHYRDSCIYSGGHFVKDLRLMQGIDLSRTLIVDNSPASYMNNPENAIPIEDFMGMDSKDSALLDLLPLLRGITTGADVRSVIGFRILDIAIN